MPKRRPKRRSRVVSEDGPDPVDVHVGKRVRERRVSLSMSQTDLGEYLRLSFQQIQKYERGVNRISASKLWALSHFFKVPVEWFFEGLGETSKMQNDVMAGPEARDLDAGLGRLLDGHHILPVDPVFVVEQERDRAAEGLAVTDARS